MHSGIYYEPDSLKAPLCVEGAAQMYAFCDEHAIDYRRCGKLIIARSEDELPRLDELERRGRAHGVAGLRRVVSGGIPEIEPNAVGVALRLKRTEQPVVKGMITSCPTLTSRSLAFTSRQPSTVMCCLARRRSPSPAGRHTDSVRSTSATLRGL